MGGPKSSALMLYVNGVGRGAESREAVCVRVS